MSDEGALKLGSNESGVFVDEPDEGSKDFQGKMISTLPRIAIAAVFHPFTYVKTLMQLGHEPLPLSTGKALVVIGRPTMFLPNSLTYVNYIRNECGLAATYTGVTASVMGALAGSAAAIAFGQHLDREHPNFGGGQVWTEGVEERHISDTVSFNRMTRTIAREGLATIVGTLAARPFQVVMIRQMAQYIGGETKYGGVIDTVKTIVAEEGYGGLWAGLYPQVVAEIGILVCTHAGIYLLNRTYVHYVLPYSEADDSDDKSSLTAMPAPKIIRMVVPMLVNSLFYPFQCVATCMAVNACGLSAGRPLFGSWQDCYDHLTTIKGSKRGNGMFLRRYEGPLTYKGTKPYASNKLALA